MRSTVNQTGYPISEAVVQHRWFLANHRIGYLKVGMRPSFSVLDPVFTDNRSRGFKEREESNTKYIKVRTDTKQEVNAT